MEHSANITEGRAFVVARLHSEDAATRLRFHLDSARNDFNQLVLEQITLDRQVVMALKDVLESDHHSWVSLKFVDCRLARAFAAGGQSEEGAEHLYRTVESDLQFPPHLFIQATAAAFQMDRNPNPPFLPLDCIGGTKSLRVCTKVMTEDIARRLKDTISFTTTLEEVSLSGSRRLGGTSLSRLVKGLRANTSIKVLDLGDCQLDDARTMSFLAALKEHNSLHTLDLSNNQFSDESLKVLASDLLCDKTKVQVLDLSMQQCRMNMKIIAPALVANATLKTLDLKNSRLVDEDVVALADLLCANRCIQDLNLSDNRQITDGGIIYFASKLPQMKNLKRLNIRKTQPPTGSLAVMEALRAGMQKNTQLTLLRTVFWKYVCHGRHVQHLVNLNRGGRRALDETLSPALWALVFQRANEMTYYCPLTQNAKTDAVYHLFRYSPSLWEDHERIGSVE